MKNKKQHKYRWMSIQKGKYLKQRIEDCPKCKEEYEKWLDWIQKEYDKKFQK